MVLCSQKLVLKTKDFFVQKFVNLRKWLFFNFQHPNPHNTLETKEKVVLSNDFCLMVAGMGFIRAKALTLWAAKRRCFHFVSAEPVVQPPPHV